jgi:hypothetical protein
MSSGYDYSRAEILKLSIRMQFPERSAEESAIIWDFLQAHGLEYDRFSITVRVGQGVPVDPTHSPGVRRQAFRNSQLRIDLMTWVDAQPFIWEVKLRANHHAIGQLFTYRHLWMEENPDAPEPRLGVLARAIDPDMERVYQSAGIAVYLYAAAAGDDGTPTSGVSPNDGETL